MKKFVFMVLFVAMIATAAVAQTPTVMNYQGRLTDNTPGQTPIDTTLPMDFFIYDVSVGGAFLWNEPWGGGVTVVGGIFSVLLGSNGVPLTSAVFTGGSTRYLEIIVNGETLTPRQQLGTVGFADVAASADDLDCVSCVTATDIAINAVGASEIAANAVGANEITADAVGASEIANGAVGALEIATDAVGAAEIAAGAVRSSEIAPNAVGNSEFNNLDSFDFRGDVTIDNAGGKKFVTQYLGVNKLEWWANSTNSYLYHRPASSYFAVNDATGNWGINTTVATHKFQVNGTARVTSFLQADSHVGVAGNVDVAGAVWMGYERVSASATTSITSSTCFQGGAWTCYQANVTASCPAGKVVLGGGCACSGVLDSICYGYPSSSTGYTCFNAENDSSQSFTAYAICARMGN
jgi:hypothetical protein